MTEFRWDRYQSKIVYVEQEHNLALFAEDLSRMFDVPWDDHIHWFVEDIAPTEEQDGSTRVTCADDRTGMVLLHETFEETSEFDPFYEIVLSYVSDTLGYNLGELVVQVDTLSDPIEQESGILIKLKWTTYE